MVAGAQQIDTEASVLEQLTALRAQVIGEVRDGSQTDADALRAALRRAFECFELLPYGSFDTDVPREMWIGEEPLRAEGYSLLPHVGRLTGTRRPPNVIDPSS